MRRLHVNTVLSDKVLVSRESARSLEHALRSVLEEEPRSQEVIVDFEGVAGVAPSFLDELLTVFESILGEANEDRRAQLIVANPPTRLSLKFEAVARGHGMSVHPRDDGSWALTLAA